jgi:hypothetical protein
MQVTGSAPTTGARLLAIYGSSLTIDTPVGSTDPDWVLRSVSGSLSNASGTVYFLPRATLSDTGPCSVWGIQLEANKYPTSYIGDIDGSSSFVRSADVLSADSNTVAPGGFFDIEMVIRPHYATSEISPGGAHDLLYLDEDNRVYFDEATSTMYFLENGSTTISTAATWSRDATITVRMRYLAGLVELTISGASTGNGTTTVSQTNTALALPSRLYLLGNSSGAQESADLMKLDALQSPSDKETFETDWGNYPFYEQLGLVETSATVISDNAEPFALVDGQTLLFDLDIPAVGQSVTFNTADFSEISQALALEIATAINDQTSGVSATIDTNGRLVISSSSVGNLSRLSNFSGTSAATLGFDSSTLGQGAVTGTPVANASFDSAVLIDPEAYEDFEDGWDDLWSSVLSLTGQATFDIDPSQNFEDFEQEWNEITGSFTTSGTTTIASNSHGLGLDDRVRFDGTLPSPLNDTTRYWVVLVPTENQFEVSTTQGGGALTISAGSGSWFRGSVSTFKTALTFAGDTEAAVFDAEAALDHDPLSGWADLIREFTFSGSDLNFTAPTPHGFQVDDVVEFTTTGTLPTPLSTATAYFVVFADNTKINVSATVGGGAISLSGGSGTHSVKRPYRADFSLAGSDLETVTFGLAADLFEDFEDVRDRITIAVNPTTDTVLATGHPYSNGERVTFESNGALPANIRLGQYYYVVNAGANNFQIEQQVGAGALNIGDHGTGVHEAIADPDIFWTEQESI